MLRDLSISYLALFQNTFSMGTIPKTEVKHEGHGFASEGSTSYRPPPEAGPRSRFAAKKTNASKSKNTKAKKKPVKRRDRDDSRNFPGKTAVVSAAAAEFRATDVNFDASSPEVVEIDIDDDEDDVVEIVGEHPASVEVKARIPRYSDQTVASEVVASHPNNPIPISSRSPSVTTPPVTSSPASASATLELPLASARVMGSPTKPILGIKKVPKMSPRRSDLPSSLYQTRPRVSQSADLNASDVVGQLAVDGAGGSTARVVEKVADSFGVNLPSVDQAKGPTVATVNGTVNGDGDDAANNHDSEQQRRIVKVLVTEAQLEALRSLGIQILE